MSTSSTCSTVSKLFIDLLTEKDVYKIFYDSEAALLKLEHIISDLLERQSKTIIFLDAKYYKKRLYLSRRNFTATKLLNTNNLSKFRHKGCWINSLN